MAGGNSKDPYAITFQRYAKHSKKVAEHSTVISDPAQDNMTGNNDGILQSALDSLSPKGAMKDSCMSPTGNKTYT